MPDKAYISNILKVWTPAAQQELLDSVGEKLTVYQDDLRPGQRKHKDPAALAQRADMLRPTSRRNRDETIYVAALGLLAWDLRDFGRCLAATQARGSTIVALNTGRRIGPDAGAKEISEAQEDFTGDKRRGAVRPGRLGYEIAQEQRLADTARRIDLIRQDWGNPAIALDDLLMRAARTTKRGALQPMAYTTARKALGVRAHIFKVKAGQARARDKKMMENQL